MYINSVTVQLVAIIFVIVLQCAQMEGRLTAAKSNKDAVSPEESKKIGAGFDLSVKHWKKRKRMVSGTQYRAQGRGYDGGKGKNKRVDCEEEVEG